MNYLYRTYASNNPAGIVINLGYYALVESIVAGTDTETALFRWCGIRPQKYRPGKKGHPKTDDIIETYFANPILKNRDIARIVGCTPEMVSKVLIRIGIRRNRWDGHISKDKRYSKEKKEDKMTFGDAMRKDPDEEFYWRDSRTLEVHKLVDRLLDEEDLDHEDFLKCVNDVEEIIRKTLRGEQK